MKIKDAKKPCKAAGCRGAFRRAGRGEAAVVPPWRGAGAAPAGRSALGIGKPPAETQCWLLRVPFRWGCRARVVLRTCVRAGRASL